MLKREHVLLAGPTIDWRSMGIGGGEEVTVTVKLVGGQVSNAFLQSFIKGISR